MARRVIIHNHLSMHDIGGERERETSGRFAKAAKHDEAAAHHGRKYAEHQARSVATGEPEFARYGNATKKEPHGLAATGHLIAKGAHESASKNLKAGMPSDQVRNYVNSANKESREAEARSQRANR